MKTISLKNKLDILIVEDDEAGKIYLSELVKDIAHSIFLAENGEEALTIFEQNPSIHLILMDIKLPHKNGHEITREIRKKNKEVKIIAQTAYALSCDREKAIEAGCNDYIAKPVNKELLLQLISHQFIAFKETTSL